MHRWIVVLAACAALAGCGSNQEQTAAIYSWVASLTPAQRDELRAAAYQCKYEAHAMAAGYRGEIIQAAEERNLGDMCIKAKIAQIQATR